MGVGWKEEERDGEYVGEGKGVNEQGRGGGGRRRGWVRVGRGWKEEERKGEWVEGWGRVRK